MAKATLLVSGYGDKARNQVVTNAQSLREIAEIIQRAKPGFIGKCPLGAQLMLELKDGSKLYFIYPTDGCDSLLSENGEVYCLSNQDNAKFRSIFAKALND